MHSCNHIIKFADDTTVVGLISKNDESAYREEVQRLTAWCKANNLSLNVEKTKEMVVDFRRTQSDHSPLNINGSNVEIVKSTEFLGLHHCLVRELHRVGSLQRIVRTAEKIIGVSLPSIKDIYSKRCIRKANSIVDDPTPLSHTLHPSAVWKE
ncbi:hypothetical protein QTP70_029808, partial [Hemibagrus guttatus]